MQVLGSDGDRARSPRRPRRALPAAGPAAARTPSRWSPPRPCSGTDADLPVLAATLEPARRRGPEPARRRRPGGLVEPLGDRGPVAFVHGVVREVLLDDPGARPPAALHERRPARSSCCRPGGDEALARHWAGWPGRGRRAGRPARPPGPRPRARRAGPGPGRPVRRARRPTGSTIRRTSCVLGDVRARSGDVDGRADRAAARGGRPRGLSDGTTSSPGPPSPSPAARAASRSRCTTASRSPCSTRPPGRLPPGALRARVRARLAVAASIPAPQAERVAMGADGGHRGRGVRRRRRPAAHPGRLRRHDRRPPSRRRAAGGRRRMLALAQRLGDADGELLGPAVPAGGPARGRRLPPPRTPQITAFDRLARDARTSRPTSGSPPLWRGMRALLDGPGRRRRGLRRPGRGDRRRRRACNAQMLDDDAALRRPLGTARGAGRPGPRRRGVRRRSPARPAAVPRGDGLHVRRHRRRRGDGPLLPPARRRRFPAVPEDAEFLSGLLGAVEAAILLRDARRRAGPVRPARRPSPTSGSSTASARACWGVAAEWLARLADLLGRRADARAVPRTGRGRPTAPRARPARCAG